MKHSNEKILRIIKLLEEEKITMSEWLRLVDNVNHRFKEILSNDVFTTSPTIMTLYGAYGSPSKAYEEFESLKKEDSKIKVTFDKGDIYKSPNEIAKKIKKEIKEFEEKE